GCLPKTQVLAAFCFPEDYLISTQGVRHVRVFISSEARLPPSLSLSLSLSTSLSLSPLPLSQALYVFPFSLLLLMTVYLFTSRALLSPLIFLYSLSPPPLVTLSSFPTFYHSLSRSLSPLLHHLLPLLSLSLSHSLTLSLTLSLSPLKRL